MSHASIVTDPASKRWISADAWLKAHEDSHAHTRTYRMIDALMRAHPDHGKDRRAR